MPLFGARRSERSAPALSETVLWPFRAADPHMLSSTLYGDARFGWVQHLARANMFAPTEVWARLQQRGYPIARASFRADAHTLSGFIHWPHEGHRLVVGAPGSGKFTAVLALAMLEDDGANALVIDPKGGEAAQWSMVYRHTLAHGQRGVFVLDPCGLFPAVRSQRLNPLDVLSLKRPSFVADADRLAEALVPDENLKDPFWVRAGRKIVRALIVHAVTRQGEPRATLLDVQRWVANGLDDTLLEAMAGNSVADGLVERAAVEISDWKNAESMWQGIKAQVDASLMFLDLPGVRHVVSATDFDVRALRRERATLYVTIPNSEKATLGRWLRLVYSSVMDQIAQIPGRTVHVVIDEFAALGRFDRVLTDLATQRSGGFRYHIAVQDLNQLNELYGHGWQTVVGNCGVRQFLGLNDNFTADYLSHQLGQTTVQDGFDMQQEFADGPMTKRPRWVARALRTPSELLGMRRDAMILLTDRTRPFLLPKCHYFATEPWKSRARDLHQLTRRAG